MSADAVPILTTDPVSPLESLINTPIAAVQSVRQGFNFRWANAAARTAQTGMRAGDVGYQVDTSTQYLYTASWGVWAIPITSYTPTITGLTLGNGSISGSYSITNGIMTAFVSVTLGSTSAVTGSMTISYPVTLSNGANIAGSGFLRDTVNGPYYPVAIRPGSTSVANVNAVLANGTYAATANISATAPFTWAATDNIYIMLTGTSA